jgi:hypothetical protein
MMPGRFNKKFMSCVGCAIWIFAVVSIGLTESFPDRPMQAELKTVVTLGMECARGVNERCWATQYSINSVQYHVSPFTNTAGFYLDQSLMGQMASKIRSLVQYYVNLDTVYDGTTNISMLTVAGVWAELEIGDWTSQFTRTFASGTNAAIYGDSPWRICYENLDERYDVMNVLRKRFLMHYVSNGTNFAGFSSPPYNQAKYKGDTAGAINNGHLYYTSWGGDLGLARGSEHTILIDGRVAALSSGIDYITLGQGSPRYGAYDGKSMCFFLDRTEGQSTPAERRFTAQIEFSAPEDILGVYNVICVESYPGQNPQSSYTRSSVNVASTLFGPAGDPSGFIFYPVLTFPFQYCTDE